MNTVIVPVDFSETSINAANYAAQLLTGRDDLKIILFHLSESELDFVTAPDLLDELIAKLTSDYGVGIEGV